LTATIGTVRHFSSYAYIPLSDENRQVEPSIPFERNMQRNFAAILRAAGLGPFSVVD
jgi:hypothetical protein